MDEPVEDVDPMGQDSHCIISPALNSPSGHGRIVKNVVQDQLVKKEPLSVSFVRIKQVRNRPAVSVEMAWSGNGMTQSLDIASLVGTTPTKKVK